MLLLSMTAVSPVSAQTDGNIICEYSGGGSSSSSAKWSPTDIGTLLQTLTTIIVTLGAVVGIIGGAGYTLADAANPSENYASDRNDAIKYGFGIILVLYLGNTIITQVNPNLDFGCILPFSP